MRKRTLNILVVFWFTVISGYAQERTFLHLGLNEGLPQETVICITQDQYGCFWMGTSDGVVGFDGTNFYTPSQNI